VAPVDAERNHADETLLEYAIEGLDVESWLVAALVRVVENVERVSPVARAAALAGLLERICVVRPDLVDGEVELVIDESCPV